MRYFILTIIAAFCFSNSPAQSYVFAQLTGSPVNTTGWNMTGSATVTDVTGTGNTEVRLCQALNYQSGGVFYNQPINLTVCNRWIAEFDFRIFDGTGADGIAFCFLDVPPSGFVNGGGLGIPATANGLKVCFDTYLNCAATGSFTPKLELRWGNGYDECWSQPTINNATGALSIIRSNAYCHAKIFYNAGNIEVYLNNVLFLTGFQQFNFNGYLGFTASTGGSTDNHSIKNVVIYTDMPPSEAGADITVCSGQSVQLGTTPDNNNTYSWTPGTNLSATNIANPTFSAVNTTSSAVTTKYFVNTAFANGSGCASVDSILVTVLPGPAVSIAANQTTICSGLPVSFTATVTNGGSSPTLQWQVNGVNAGTNSTSFNSASLANGDVVTCSVSTGGPCPAVQSNAITITVTTPAVPTVVITSTSSTICQGTAVSFATSVTNEGLTPIYQWNKNGSPVGSNLPTYTDNNLQNGDVITCTMTSNATCVSPASVTSNQITITVTGPVTPTISIIPSDNNVCANTSITFTATITNGGTAPVYQWTVNGVNVGTNTATYSASSFNNNDVITCTLTSNSTCASTPTVSSNNVTMVIVPLTTPTITITSTTVGICSGGSMTFNASNTNGGSNPQYQWKKNGANVGANNSSYTDNSLVVGDVVTCVLTSNATCQSTNTATSNSITVNIFSNPVVTLDHNPNLCVGSTRQLDAGNFSSYLWSDGTTGKTLTINGTGTYFVQVTDANGCKGSDTAKVTNLLSSPSGFLPGDSAICAYDRFMLAPTSTFNTYLWSTNSTAPQIEIKQAGVYWLQVTTSNNCTGRDSILYTLKDCGAVIYFPTAFTPNGDGLNDVFKPLLFNHVNNYEFNVYNRWGQLVFSSRTPNKGWDGKLNGKPQTSQTFVWMCTYQFDGQAKKTEKGTFVLIR